MQKSSPSSKTKLVAWTRPFPSHIRNWRSGPNAPTINEIIEQENGTIANVEHVLTTWRKQLLARMATERAYFLGNLWGLSEEVLCNEPVIEGWTAKDMLAHVGGWDGFFSEWMGMVLNGRLHNLQELNSAHLDQRNHELHKFYAELEMETAVALLLKTRSEFRAVLNRASDHDLHRTLRLPWGSTTSLRTWAGWRFRHDASHAADLRRWRKSLPKEILAQRLGPKYIQRAQLRASQREFLTTAALVEPAERLTRPVCGVWNLKDLVGHLTDWEKIGVLGLQQLLAGNSPVLPNDVADFDSFNEKHAAIRKDQPWQAVWQDFIQTRQTLMRLYDQLPEATLAQRFTSPWQSEINVYRFVSIWGGHMQEHTRDIRAALQLPNWPKRLL